MNDDLMLAGVDMLQRVGALEFQIRYEDESKPVVWIAVARFKIGLSGRPVPETERGMERWECAASLDPVRAIVRLCEQMIDGGVCSHCSRPAGITDDFEGSMPLDVAICWYRFDPELKTFRRGCE